MKLKKIGLLSLSISTLSLSACLFGGEDSQKNDNLIPSTSDVIYEIPNTLTTASSNKLKVSAKTNESVFDVYKPIPTYITIADKARQTVAEILTNLRAQNLPEEFTYTEGSTSINVMPLDSAQAKWSHVQWSNTATGEALDLKVSYEGFTRGLATLSNDKEDISIQVGFTNENEDTEGRRLRVEVQTSIDNLQNLGDPQRIIINAMKKDDQVYVSGSSYHPTFKDTSDFWFQGNSTPTIYAFQAMADETQDQAVLRAAFAPSAAVDENLMTDWALDKRVLLQLRDNIVADSEENPTTYKYISWSLTHEKPITDEDYSDILLHEPSTEPSSLTTEDVEKFAALQASSPDAKDEWVQLTLFAQAKQPIFLSTGAQILGHAEILAESEILIEAEELDNTPELEIAN